MNENNQRGSQWFGTFLVGTHRDGPDLEIIEFVTHPLDKLAHTECLALDGTIVNSPAIRQAPLTWAPVMCDSGWAL